MVSPSFESQKSQNRDRRDRDRPDARREQGPPPVTNSRFAAAAEADRSNRDERDSRDNRGPPPVTNSRFAAAADADRPAFRDDRGPPPVTNSRFAAAADADRSTYRDDRGPPPVTNSRFAAAADADRPAYRDDRGPPPVANSRFAAAAAADEAESHDRDERRKERDSFYNRGDDRDNNRGAMPQNSRFANAAAMDEDYVDREERQRRMNDDRDRDFGDDGDRGGGGYDRGGGGGYDRGGGDRGGDRGGYGGRDGGRDRGRDDYDRRGGGGGPFGGSDSRQSGGYESAPRRSRVDDLLKPKAPVVADNILKPPDVKNLDPAHADNVLMMPAKALSKDRDADVLAPPKKKAAEKEEPTAKEEAAPAVDAANEAELLKEFASGNKKGDELKAWCDANRVQLPSVKKLVFHMLTEQEKLNPDPDCAWAEPTKFGAAILSLVADDIVSQMQVLWGIQMYCDKLGFPKLNDEYVAQSMFRAMYKFDLAEADSFTEWKEDESDEHEQGKMKAIIQTVDWFNWLEEDDEEEEEYGEDYEE